MILHAFCLGHFTLPPRGLGWEIEGGRPGSFWVYTNGGKGCIAIRGAIDRGARGWE